MASRATWYLGPLGDMRPLVVPEPDIQINDVRYGGVRQGLSGARRMDITGFRSDFEFNFRYLDQEEFLWLEALHTRMVNGPFYLLNPLKRNRLTQQASRLLPAEFRNSGINVNDSPYTVERDWPADIRIPGRSLKLSGWTGGSLTVNFDQGRPAPLLDDETLLASVYLRATATYPGVKLRVSWYDENLTFIRNDDLTVTATTTWSRHWFVYHEAPTNAAAVELSLVLGSATTSVYVAAPMLETGVYSPSPWEIGGAAPKVLVDQIPTTSPIYPLRNATMTLLEA